MGAERQKIQQLAFPVEGRGEAPKSAGEGSAASMAKRVDESPAVYCLTYRTAVYGPVRTVV